jgi:hypothetical protein
LQKKNYGLFATKSAKYYAKNYSTAACCPKFSHKPNNTHNRQAIAYSLCRNNFQDVRTMSELSPEQIQVSLTELANTLKPVIGERGHVALYDELAKRLSVLARRKTPWGWRYIQGVIKGSITPSAALARATLALGATLDGVPPVAANTQAIQVYAEAGRVKPGSIILAASKLCARPACPVSFVPIVPHQKFCSRECARKARQELKAERNPP